MKEVLSIGSQITQNLWVITAFFAFITALFLLYFLYFYVRWSNIERRLSKIKGLYVSHAEEYTTLEYKITPTLMVEGYEMTDIIFLIYSKKILLKFRVLLNDKSIDIEFCLKKENKDATVGMIYSETELVILLKRMRNLTKIPEIIIPKLYDNAKGWECGYEKL